MITELAIIFLSFFSIAKANFWEVNLAWEIERKRERGRESERVREWESERVRERKIEA